MKVENRLENSDAERYEAQQRRVGREAMQRIANPFGQTTLTALKTLEKSLSSEVEKTTGHFANQDGTLKTLPSGWWLLPAIFSGAAVLAHVLGVV